MEEEEYGVSKVETSQLTQLMHQHVWALLNMTGWNNVVDSSNQWVILMQNIAQKTADH